MTRFSFSRQPTVWIGVLSAAAAFAVVLGVHIPEGFEAALAALITAAGAAVTWTQVSPASQTVRVDAAPEVQITTVDGDKHVQRTYRDGRLTKTAASIGFAQPADVAAKSAADLKAAHDRTRAALGITPETFATGGLVRAEDAATATEHGIIPPKKTAPKKTAKPKKTARKK